MQKSQVADIFYGQMFIEAILYIIFYKSKKKQQQKKQTKKKH